MCPEGSLIAKGLQSFMNFAGGYYDQVSSICFIALATWATIWMAWNFTKLATGTPNDAKEIIEDFIGIVVASALLKGPALAFESYSAIMKAGIWAASKTFSTSDVTNPGNVSEIVCYATNGIDDAMFKGIKISLLDTGWRFSAVFFTIVAFIPVALFMIKVLKLLAEPFVDVTILFILAPFTILFIGIAPMRSAAAQAIKLFVVSMKELIVVCAVVGVMMGVIFAASGKDGINASTDQMNISIVSGYLGSTDYWLVLTMIIFYYFALDRAVQMPGRLLALFTAKAVSFKVPHPF